MKLLLIQPSHLKDDGTVFKSDRLVYPGLALPLIAGLTPNRYDIELVNEYSEDIDFGSDADIIGISFMTTQAVRAYQIADEFRRRGKAVVMGGFHPSLMFEEASGHSDAVVIGEAENVWEKLLADFERGSLKKSYKSEERPDLSKLPVPRYDLIKRSGYSTYTMPVQTTRGCPHNCDFCSVTQFYGSSYRHRPVADVIRDIKATNSRYIFFVDDNIGASKRYCRELFEAIKSLNLIWGSQVNISFADDPALLKLAYDSGCVFLFCGVESVNEETLAGCGKGFNKVSEYARQLKAMKDAGIEPMVSMIFGLDGDGTEAFENNLKFLMDNKIAIAYFFILAPAPGTEYFNRFERGGRLFSKDWSKYSGDHVVFKPAKMTPGQLEKGFWKTYKRFYSYPSIFRRILFPLKRDLRYAINWKFNILHHRSLRRGVDPLRG